MINRGCKQSLKEMELMLGDNSCNNMRIFTIAGLEDNIYNIFFDCNQLLDTSCDGVGLYCYGEDLTMLEYNSTELQWSCDADICCPDITYVDLTLSPTFDTCSNTTASKCKL